MQVNIKIKRENPNSDYTVEAQIEEGVGASLIVDKDEKIPAAIKAVCEDLLNGLFETGEVDVTFSVENEGAQQAQT